MGFSTLFLVEDKFHEKADYHGWKMSIDLTLEDQGVLDHVRGNIVEPPSNAPPAARKKWKNGEVKAKKIIRDSINKHLVAYIFELDTSKEIYDRLVSLFKVNDENQVLFLRNKLREIKKGKDESMQAYFLRITEIKNDLLSIGETITDREMALTTLGELPSKWYVFRTTLLNNNVIPGFEELMARCIQEETRVEEQEMPLPKERLDLRVEEKDDVTFAILQVTMQGNALIERTLTVTMIKIPFMVIKGMENSIAKAEYYLPVALSTSAPSNSMGIWLIDSGASRHFTGYKEVLHYLVEKETNLEIVLGDDMKYLVKGVGNVSLKLNQGNTIHLQDVLYVLDLKKNLVSILAMEDKGYKVTFNDGKVRIWKNNVKYAFTLGFRVDSLSQVSGILLGVMPCDTTLQSKLWHQRFSHLHYKDLPDVRQMVTWMPEFQVEKEGVCPRCAEGKLKRGPFPSSQRKTPDILQLVHLDISALIENQTEKKIKILRTDNGTEYESNEFHDFCKEVGIKRENTTPYIPEQNGVVERKNHTIMEAVRAMLHDQRLLKFLWVEAANTAIYVQNQYPHQALGSKTPEEKFIVGQREFFISHDVTFDEDMALSKVENLSTLRSSQEADTKEPKEKDDESMPYVEEPMDPIDPPPHEPSSSRKRPSWLRGLLDDAEGHAAPRGTFRESKKPNRYQGYLTIMSTIMQNKSSSFSDAVKHQVWKDAMTKEYESIMKNDVWEVVPRPQDKIVVTSKWLYKIKHAADGSMKKYKDHFVARGFFQKEGIDYDVIFAPVARYTIICSIIALTASQGWNLHQMYVKTAFLHGSIKEEVYVEQPEGFD
eukprot:PITA_33927